MNTTTQRPKMPAQTAFEVYTSACFLAMVMGGAVAYSAWYGWTH